MAKAFQAGGGRMSRIWEEGASVPPRYWAVDVASVETVVFGGAAEFAAKIKRTYKLKRAVIC
jgi:hypothetical protein